MPLWRNAGTPPWASVSFALDTAGKVVGMTDDENEARDEAVRLVDDVCGLLAASALAGLRIEEQGGPDSRASAHNLLLHRFTATAIALLINMQPGQEREDYREHLSVCVTEAPVDAVLEIAADLFPGGMWSEAEKRGKAMVDAETEPKRSDSGLLESGSDG